jgi:hypothetical protein
VPLYTLMRLVALRWHAHVQEIEGINNIIQAMTRQAPRISLALLDARVGTRKYIGLGSRDTKSARWKDLAPIIYDVVDDAVAHYDAIDNVLSGESRWSHPVAALPGVQPAPAMLLDHDWSHAFERPTLAWAAHNGKRILDQCKTMRETYPIYANPVLCIGGEFWVCAMHFKFMLFLRRGRAIRDGAGGVIRVELVNPPEMKSSMKLLAETCVAIRHGQRNGILLSHQISMLALDHRSSVLASAINCLELEDLPAQPPVPRARAIAGWQSQ